MPKAISVNGASFGQMPGKTIGMIRRLLSCPSHRFSWIMLKITHEANVSHFREGIRKIIHDATSNRTFLTLGLIIRH
jgi:hypothetical protein